MFLASELKKPPLAVFAGGVKLEQQIFMMIGVAEANDEEGVKWLFSFLSADKKKIYCLYEAPTAEAIRIAARRLDLPADVVIEVSDLRPEMFN
jgi:Protein of unknown function (DUF4242)